MDNNINNNGNPLAIDQSISPYPLLSSVNQRHRMNNNPLILSLPLTLIPGPLSAQLSSQARWGWALIEKDLIAPDDLQ